MTKRRKDMAVQIIMANVLLVSFASWVFGQTSQATIRHVKTSDGVDLHVVVKGTGTPCLYIHGGPGSGSYWMEKFSAGLLEDHLQMVYLDQRGVGRSSSPNNGDYSLFHGKDGRLAISRWRPEGACTGGQGSTGALPPPLVFFRRSGAVTRDPQARGPSLRKWETI